MASKHLSDAGPANNNSCPATERSRNRTIGQEHADGVRVVTVLGAWVAWQSVLPSRIGRIHLHVIERSSLSLHAFEAANCP